MLTPEQIADGWIEHDGGPCPVEVSARVKVSFRKPSARDKFTSTTVATASFFQIGQYDWWRWQSPNRSNDIIAYRPETPDAP